MSDKPLYPVSFVNDCGGPKFQNEAGYFRAADDITAHCATFGGIPERHDEYPTATGLTNLHSEKTIIPKRPLTENSKISGSDIIQQTYSMYTLEDFLRMPLSLFEMADRIKDIPTPRKKLFQLVVTISGLAPNTVKMILCPTTSGIYPKEQVCKRIARSMRLDVNKLFPSDRLKKGSIVNIYSRLPSKKIDYNRFITLLSEASHSSEKTVRKWLKVRRVPTRYARSAIAKVIGVSISQLFPLEE